MSEATIPELHRPPAINTDPDDTVSPLGAHNRSESAPPGLAPLQRQSSSRRFPLASPSARQARVNIASNLFPHGAWGSLSGSQAHVQPNDTPQQPQEAQQQKQSGIHFVFNFSILIPVLFVTWDKECDTPVRSYLILLIFLNAFNASMFFFSQEYTRRYGRLSRNFLRRWGYVSTIAFLVTFTLGNAWTWASEKCDNILIGTAIFYLVTVYISIFLLLVVAVLVCCFLPHILEQLQARQPANRGATPEQIASLEEHKFERGECEEEDALCSICMDEYSPGVSLRKLPCNHHFHASCIDKWLGLKALCPLCNRKVFAAEGGEEGGDAEQQPLGDNAVQQQRSR